MKKIIFILVVAFSFASSAFAVDEDGCFAAGNCVSMSAKWKGGDTFVSRYTNNCSKRIVINMCNERKGKSSDCGQTGIRAGKSSSWATYSNATGRYSAEWVGSTKGNSDWVCAGKVDGWGDDPY